MVTSIERKILANPNIAVFSRNHPAFLESAVRIALAHPERLITFRAAKPWRLAHTVLKHYGAIPIYFALVGGTGEVEYKATLHSVLLYPKPGDTETENLLRLSLEETENEGLWDGEVRTLYVIRQCHKLAKPFPMTSLIKFKTDKPISERFGYSYSVVYKYAGAPQIDIVISPEEVTEAERYYEGATKKISVNAYERNRAARNRCIEHYGTDCVVCGMSFQREYGEIGEGFIHVHHLKPLTRTGERYEVDPIRDLRPVCPNCHAMLHKRSPAFSIEELRNIWRSQRTKP